MIKDLHINSKIIIPEQFLFSFCEKWKIVEFSLFGSVLRDDFSEKSDVDVIVNFSADTKWSLFDLMDMQEELQKQFGRKVDLVNKKAIERSKNPYRRNNILNSYKVIYEKK